MQNRIIALAVSVISLLSAYAQKYDISGTAPKENKFVYFRNIQERTLDSVSVKAGKFHISGEADGKLFGLVSLKSGQSMCVLLDGNITVNFIENKFGGTAENNAFCEWQNSFNVPVKRIQALSEERDAYRKRNAPIPDSVLARTSADYEEQRNLMNDITVKCCEQNSQSRFPAYFLVQTSFQLEKSEIIRLAEEGRPAYMNVSLLQRLKSSIQGWKRQLPGTPFTDLEMNDTTGTAHKLSEYVGNGKYVLIDFWASWCGPCRQEMPNVKALYEKYKDRGFDIVGLSFDNDRSAWIAAIHKLGIPWHHLSDLKGWQSLAGETYGINAIPATLLIGPDGKIIAGSLSTEEVDQKLGELLK